MLSTAYGQALSIVAEAEGVNPGLGTLEDQQFLT
jgi:hypothetical protein